MKEIWILALFLSACVARGPPPQSTQSPDEATDAPDETTDDTDDSTDGDCLCNRRQSSD